MDLHIQTHAGLHVEIIDLLNIYFCNRKLLDVSFCRLCYYMKQTNKNLHPLMSFAPKHNFSLQPQLIITIINNNNNNNHS